MHYNKGKIPAQAGIFPFLIVPVALFRLSGQLESYFHSVILIYQ